MGSADNEIAVLIDLLSDKLKQLITTWVVVELKE